MTPLRWTREAPKEAGFYWVRPVYAAHTGDPFVVEAIGFGMGGRGVHHFEVAGLEDTLHYPAAVLDLCGSATALEWAGPIAPPEEPRSGGLGAAEEEAT